MKLLLIHVGIKLKRDNEGNLYINGEFSNDVLQRYIEITNQLSVMFRVEDTIYEKEFAQSNFEKFDSDNIKLIEYENTKKSIRDFISIKKRKKNKEIVKRAIKDNDKIILRLPSECGSTVSKYAKKYKKKCFAEVVACTWDALWNYGIKGKILAPISYLSMKKTIKQMDYTLYVTEKFLQKRYPNENETLGCSDVNISKIDNDILENRIKKVEQKKDCKHLSIGTIAAVDVKYKGQEYVIKAISKLKKEGYDIKYYLVGSGNDNRLKELSKQYGVKENIIFIGALPHDKIFKYLDKLDLYIQPSKQEGLCRAIIEAMSRACPVIASNAGGNSELIKESYIFKKGKYKEIIKIIKNLNKDTLKEMSKENYDNSLQYTRTKLDNKRKEFYMKYIKED